MLNPAHSNDDDGDDVFGTKWLIKIRLYVQQYGAGPIEVKQPLRL